MSTIRLGHGGRIDLPKSVREALHLEPGQRFVVLTRGDTITLVPERTMAWARGRLKGADTSAYRDRENDAGHEA